MALDPPGHRAHETKSTPREKITATAIRLFDTQGVHLTGINQIIDEPDVAKKTFYGCFPSKDDMIVAYFTEKDRIWFGRLEAHVNVPAESPRERLLGVFDYLEEWFAEADFCGCPFIRALSEFQSPDTPKPIRECLNRHFGQTAALVEGLLKDARPKDYARWPNHGLGNRGPEHRQRGRCAGEPRYRGKAAGVSGRSGPRNRLRQRIAKLSGIGFHRTRVFLP